MEGTTNPPTEFHQVTVVSAQPGYYFISPSYEGDAIVGLFREPIIAWQVTTWVDALNGPLSSWASSPIIWAGRADKTNSPFWAIEGPTGSRIDGCKKTFDNLDKLLAYWREEKAKRKTKQ